MLSAGYIKLVPGVKVWTRNPYPLDESYREQWLSSQVSTRPLWIPAEVLSLGRAPVGSFPDIDPSANNPNVSYVTVRTTLEPKMVVRVPASELLPMNSKTGLDDISDFTFLHEAAIGYNVTRRYLEGKSITRATDKLLLSVNPGHNVTDADGILLNDYHYYARYRSRIPKRVYDALPPARRALHALPSHIFDVAEQASNELAEKNSSQALVFTGDTGSGKSEAFKASLQYLLLLAPLAHAGIYPGSIHVDLVEAAVEYDQFLYPEKYTLDPAADSNAPHPVFGYDMLGALARYLDAVKEGTAKLPLRFPAKDIPNLPSLLAHPDVSGAQKDAKVRQGPLGTARNPWIFLSNGAPTKIPASSPLSSPSPSMSDDEDSAGFSAAFALAPGDRSIAFPNLPLSYPIDDDGGFSDDDYAFDTSLSRKKGAKLHSGFDLSFVSSSTTPAAPQAPEFPVTDPVRLLAPGLPKWARVLLAGVSVLEAFGSAATPSNPNSSRYVQSVRLWCTKGGYPVGAKLDATLLDSRRVLGPAVDQASYTGANKGDSNSGTGLDSSSVFSLTLPHKNNNASTGFATPPGRNFHVLYQLSEGVSSDLRGELFLAPTFTYKILATGRMDPQPFGAVPGTLGSHSTPNYLSGVTESGESQYPVPHIHGSPCPVRPSAPGNMAYPGTSTAVQYQTALSDTLYSAPNNALGNTLTPVSPYAAALHDGENWENTVKCLKEIGVETNVLAGLTRLLAGILHAGNIRFTTQPSEDPNTPPATVVVHPGDAFAAARLFGVDSAAFLTALTKRADSIHAAFENGAPGVYVRPSSDPSSDPSTPRGSETPAPTAPLVFRSPAEAALALDAFLSRLYTSIFAWLVATINKALDDAVGGPDGIRAAAGMAQLPSGQLHPLDVPTTPPYILLVDGPGVEGMLPNIADRLIRSKGAHAHSNKPRSASVSVEPGGVSDPHVPNKNRSASPQKSGANQNAIVSLSNSLTSQTLGNALATRTQTHFPYKTRTKLYPIDDNLAYLVENDPLTQGPLPVDVATLAGLDALVSHTAAERLMDGWIDATFRAQEAAYIEDGLMDPRESALSHHFGSQAHKAGVLAGANETLVLPVEYEEGAAAAAAIGDDKALGLFHLLEEARAIPGMQNAAVVSKLSQLHKQNNSFLKPIVAGYNTNPVQALTNTSHNAQALSLTLTGTDTFLATRESIAQGSVLLITQSQQHPNTVVPLSLLQNGTETVSGNSSTFSPELLFGIRHTGGTVLYSGCAFDLFQKQGGNQLDPELVAVLGTSFNPVLRACMVGRIAETEEPRAFSHYPDPVAGGASPDLKEAVEQANSRGVPLLDEEDMFLESALGRRHPPGAGYLTPRRILDRALRVMAPLAVHNPAAQLPSAIGVLDSFGVPAAAPANWIRAIRPNASLSPYYMDQTMLHAQLMYSGVLHAVALAHMGLTVKMDYNTFYERYYVLSQPLLKLEDNIVPCLPSAAFASMGVENIEETLQQRKLESEAAALAGEDQGLINYYQRLPLPMPYNANPQELCSLLLMKILEHPLLSHLVDSDLKRHVVVGKRSALFMRKHFYEAIEALREVRLAILDGRAIAIQAAWRGYMVRASVAKIYKGIQRIQAGWNMAEQRKKWLVVRRSAIAIQAHIKGWLQFLRYRTLKAATIRLQKWTRYIAARKRWLRMRTGLRAVHFVARGFLVRAQIMAMISAITKIQAAARVFIARNRMRAVKNAAVTAIQSAFRGRSWRLENEAVLAHLSARRMERAQHRVVAKLQALFKGMRQYRDYQYLLFGVYVAKFLWKGRKDRFTYLNDRRNVILCQAAARGWLVRSRLAKVKGLREFAESMWKIRASQAEEQVALVQHTLTEALLALPASVRQKTLELFKLPYAASYLAQMLSDPQKAYNAAYTKAHPHAPVLVSFPVTSLLELTAAKDTFAAFPSGLAATFAQLEQQLREGSWKHPNKQSSVPLSLFEPTHSASVAMGSGHVLVSAANGAVFTWGTGYQGQCGHGILNGNAEPRLVTSLANGDIPFPTPLNAEPSAPVVIPPALRGPISIRMVAAGEEHSLALTSTGLVLAWGAGKNGQLGTGSWTNSPSPAYVRFDINPYKQGAFPETLPLRQGSLAAFATLSKAVEIAAAGYHSYARTSSGELYSWGSSTHLGIGAAPETLIEADYCNAQGDVSVPVLNATLKAAGVVKQVATNLYHSAAILASGELYTWGSHASEGLLGHGDELYHARTTATAAVSAGQEPRLLLEDVPATGSPSKGLRRIVAGPFQPVSTPKRVEGLTAEAIGRHGKIVQVACGLRHTVALTQTGRVYTWGSNTLGQLGVGCVGYLPLPILQRTGTAPLPLAPPLPVFQGHGKPLLPANAPRNYSSVPCYVYPLDKQRIVSIAATAHGAYAMTDKKETLAWGLTSSATTEPPVDATALLCTASHAIALSRSNSSSNSKSEASQFDSSALPPVLSSYWRRWLPHHLKFSPESILEHADPEDLPGPSVRSPLLLSPPLPVVSVPTALSLPLNALARCPAGVLTASSSLGSLAAIRYDQSVLPPDTILSRAAPYLDESVLLSAGVHTPRLARSRFGTPLRPRASPLSTPGSSAAALSLALPSPGGFAPGGAADAHGLGPSDLQPIPAYLLAALAPHLAPAAPVPGTTHSAVATSVTTTPYAGLAPLSKEDRALFHAQMRAAVEAERAAERLRREQNPAGASNILSALATAEAMRLGTVSPEDQAELDRFFAKYDAMYSHPGSVMGPADTAVLGTAAPYRGQGLRLTLLRSIVDVDASANNSTLALTNTSKQQKALSSSLRSTSLGLTSKSSHASAVQTAAIPHGVSRETIQDVVIPALTQSLRDALSMNLPIPSNEILSLLVELAHSPEALSTFACIPHDRLRNFTPTHLAVVIERLLQLSREHKITLNTYDSLDRGLGSKSRERFGSMNVLPFKPIVSPRSEEIREGESTRPYLSPVMNSQASSFESVDSAFQPDFDAAADAPVSPADKNLRQQTLSLSSEDDEEERVILGEQIIDAVSAAAAVGDAAEPVAAASYPSAPVSPTTPTRKSTAAAAALATPDSVAGEARSVADSIVPESVVDSVTAYYNQVLAESLTQQPGQHFTIKGFIDGATPLQPAVIRTLLPASNAIPTRAASTHDPNVPTRPHAPLASPVVGSPILASPLREPIAVEKARQLFQSIGKEELQDSEQIVSVNPLENSTLLGSPVSVVAAQVITKKEEVLNTLSLSTTAPARTQQSILHSAVPPVSGLAKDLEIEDADDLLEARALALARRLQMARVNSAATSALTNPTGTVPAVPTHTPLPTLQLLAQPQQQLQLQSGSTSVKRITDPETQILSPIRDATQRSSSVLSPNASYSTIVAPTEFPPKEAVIDMLASQKLASTSTSTDEDSEADSVQPKTLAFGSPPPLRGTLNRITGEQSLIASPSQPTKFFQEKHSVLHTAPKRIAPKPLPQ